VREARTRIEAGEMQKVVLARMLVALAERPLDRHVLLRRLRDREPDAYTFAVHGFVGATPELLVSRHGDVVTANPMAGTARRGGDRQRDAAAAAALSGSRKDRWEHALVVDAVRGGLEPVMATLDVPVRPVPVATGTVWHLSTLITGRLQEPRPSALALASLVHPTPAVCGTPTDVAIGAIATLEPFDRTLYAGLVGWMDANGDGEWAVALRCAEIQGSMASLFAGAGIVADSDPDDELAETDAKFESMLGALGAVPVPPLPRR
jgi:isochorismate synthase